MNTEPASFKAGKQSANGPCKPVSAFSLQNFEPKAHCFVSGFTLERLLRQILIWRSHLVFALQAQEDQEPDDIRQRVVSVSFLRSNGGCISIGKHDE
ncbi:hypothetical protein [Polaromonas sp.]|uniref:hypothetical protein n=1 Tax=Polaromonas sp. TaxID=1869339 RepID=UPI003BAA5BE5